MFWDDTTKGRPARLSRGLTIAAAILVALGASSSAIAQSMVVRSTGPSAGQFPAGKKLADKSRITLKADDRVTVLDKNGTRVLSGPGNFTLDSTVQRDQTSSTQIARLLTSSSPNRRTRTGAVRGGGAAAPAVPPRSPNLWYIVSNESGKFCVARGEALLLWRPSVMVEESAQLSGQGTSTIVTWARGNPLKTWPIEDVPLVAGGQYKLTGSDGVVHNFELVMLDQVSDQVDEVADVLISNGCDNQLGLLVETLAGAEANGPSGG